MLAEVSVRGGYLRRAPEELRGDREIVMTAVSQQGGALQFATEELRGDREIVMGAVSNFGLALQFATEHLRGDREIVMAAVSQHGGALHFATEDPKADLEIVMTAVSKTGWALEYATKDLKEDEEMLKHALEGPRNKDEVVGLKVALLSGRCCSEVFWRLLLSLEGGGEEMVLRRCAASLDLDPDCVESSVDSSLSRSPDDLKERKAQKIIKWPIKTGQRNESPISALPSCFLGMGNLGFFYSVNGPGLRQTRHIPAKTSSTATPCQSIDAIVSLEMKGGREV